jgi:hypothetical protein
MYMPIRQLIRWWNQRSTWGYYDPLDERLKKFGEPFQGPTMLIDSGLRLTEDYHLFDNFKRRLRYYPKFEWLDNNYVHQSIVDINMLALFLIAVGGPEGLKQRAEPLIKVQDELKSTELFVGWRVDWGKRDVRLVGGPHIFSDSEVYQFILPFSVIRSRDKLIITMLRGDSTRIPLDSVDEVIAVIVGSYPKRRRRWY